MAVFVFAVEWTAEVELLACVAEGLYCEGSYSVFVSVDYEALEFVMYVGYLFYFVGEVFSS